MRPLEEMHNYLSHLAVIMSELRLKARVHQAVFLDIREIAVRKTNGLSGHTCMAFC